MAFGNYPLDERIGISPGQKHSIFATQRILDMATELPYAKASNYLKELACIEVSPQKISDLIATEGKALLGRDEERRIGAFDECAIFPPEIAKKKMAIVQLDYKGYKRQGHTLMDGHQSRNNIFAGIKNIQEPQPNPGQTRLCRA